MSVLGALLRKAPGVLASRQQGINVGEQERRKRSVEDTELQRAAEERAFRQSLLQAQEARAAEEARYQTGLRPLEEAFKRSQITLNTARAAPEAPAPVKLDQFTGPDGRAYNRNPITGEATPIAGVGTKPRGDGDGSGGPGWQLVQDRDGSFKRVNVRTGAVQPLQGVSPKAPTMRPLTEAENKSSAYLKRAEFGENVFGQLDRSGYKPTARVELLGQTVRAGGLKGALANMAMGESDQQFLQAGQQFINAINRRDSGANITAAEWQDAFTRYLPRATDDPKTRQQKAAARRSELEGLRATAGRAADPTEPEPTTNPLVAATDPHAALRAKAESAIARGADPAEVAKRFRAKTGTDL